MCIFMRTVHVRMNIHMYTVRMDIHMYIHAYSVHVCDVVYVHMYKYMCVLVW